MSRCLRDTPATGSADHGHSSKVMGGQAFIGLLCESCPSIFSYPVSMRKYRHNSRALSRSRENPGAAFSAQQMHHLPRPRLAEGVEVLVAHRGYDRGCARGRVVGEGDHGKARRRQEDRACHQLPGAGRAGLMVAGRGAGKWPAGQPSPNPVRLRREYPRFLCQTKPGSGVVILRIRAGSNPGNYGAFRVQARRAGSPTVGKPWPCGRPKANVRPVRSTSGCGTMPPWIAR